MKCSRAFYQAVTSNREYQASLNGVDFEVRELGGIWDFFEVRKFGFLRLGSLGFWGKIRIKHLII